MPPANSDDAAIASSTSAATNPLEHDLSRRDPGLRDPAEDDRAEPDRAEPAPTRTILLVEDDAFVLQVACEILSSAGYRVVTARNAAEALHVFYHHGEVVHLLLTDIILPDGNGCDLALKLATRFHTFRAIFVSGYPENPATKKRLQRTKWLYLPKPFSAASLLQKVETVLRD